MTEHALDIEGYDWIYYEQTLTLAAENTENVITFYYEQQQIEAHLRIIYIDMNGGVLIHDPGEYFCHVGDLVTIYPVPVDGYCPLYPKIECLVEDPDGIVYYEYYSCGAPPIDSPNKSTP